MGFSREKSQILTVVPGMGGSCLSQGNSRERLFLLERLLFKSIKSIEYAYKPVIQTFKSSHFIPF